MFMIQMRHILKALENVRFLMICGTALMVAFSQAFHMAHFFCGSMVTIWLSKTLKNIIRQPRPKNASGYGMPSSHSQGMFYFSTYVQLNISDPTLCALAHLATLAVCWSRIRLGRHTHAQVLVGAALGVVVASCWSLIWTHTSARTDLGANNSSGISPLTPVALRNAVMHVGYLSGPLSKTSTLLSLASFGLEKNF